MSEWQRQIRVAHGVIENGGRKKTRTVAVDIKSFESSEEDFVRFSMEKIKYSCV